jgi:hypothetical protein
MAWIVAQQVVDNSRLPVEAFQHSGLAIHELKPNLGAPGADGGFIGRDRHTVPAGAGQKLEIGFHLPGVLFED